MENIKKETTQIAGRCCMVYKADSPHFLLIQPVDEHDLEVLDNEVATITSLTRQPFSLVAFQIKDWQNELTPWPAPAVFGKIPFGDGAGNTLSYMRNALIPELVKMGIYDDENMKCLLGGYSLAGLFARWACCQTSLFHGVAAVSPSVWYPDWIQYAEGRIPLASQLYLSLGDKEEKTRNPVMSQVGDHIRRLYELWTARGLHSTLEWNKGNHFQHSDVRTAKGFAWLISTLSTINN